jgi:hypothetical protein
VIAVLLAVTTMQVSAWTVTPAVATVGDTVQLTRRIAAAPGVHPRAQPLVSSSLIEPLASPVVGYAEGAVLVRYTLAFFDSGVHALPMPDIELSFGDGRVERVFGDTARVSITSVLPADADAPPNLAPSAAPIARQPRRPWVVMLPLGIVALLLVAWSLLRRRVSQRPVWRSGGGRSVYAPVEQWVRAGELRAVVSAVTDRLRDRIERDLPEAGRQLSTEECMAVVEEHRPDWPVRDIMGTLTALDRARFAPALPSDVVVLAEQVDELMAVMSRGANE